MAERHLASVVLLQVDQVEHVQPDRDLAQQVGRGLLDLHALLEHGEAGDVTTERDDLAVDDERGGLFPLQGRRQLGVLPVETLPVP